MTDTAENRLDTIDLGSLVPDWENPRFPPNAIESFGDDDDVYIYLDKQFDSASVAESIARHGFFLSEPLIAIPAAGEEDVYIVVEGNRRLAALQALARPDLRARMADARWRTIEIVAPIPTRVPVLVVPTREEVAPILGYRHVTGIAPWEPYQQARYVSSLLDAEGSTLTAADVARLIGRSVSEVKSFYRNYSIVEQAKEVFETPDVERVSDEFGVWTRAMTSSSLRDYIMAPAPRDVYEREYPLPEGAAQPLERLITWVFGRPRTDQERASGRQSKEGRLITDSRQITRLGRVIANGRGLAALENGATLDQAELAILDESAQFSDAIDRADKELSLAKRTADPTRVNAKYDVIVGMEATLVALKAFS